MGARVHALVVRDEVTYDRFHVGSDRIFRVVQETPDAGWRATGPGFALKLPHDHVEIVAVTHVHRGHAAVAPAVTSAMATRSAKRSSWMDVLPICLIVNSMGPSLEA